jgi:calcineurin-like phosphoesterase family protein
VRGFASVEEHDDAIIGNLNQAIAKQDKLFILGDVAFNMTAIERLNDLRVRLILGNHDRLNSQVYLKYFRRLEGAVKYRNFWLTHIPVLPQEIVAGVKGNVHGHIHLGGLTMNTELPYYNVAVEWRGYQPVPFDYIEEMFDHADLL